jgi:hypothetical protein
VPDAKYGEAQWCPHGKVVPATVCDECARLAVEREEKWRRLYSIEHSKGEWREIPGCECCALRRELGLER